MGEQALRLDGLHEAAEIRNIYAGTVIDVIDLALSPLIDAAEAGGLNIYADLEPKIHGTPVWKMIRAARNNHHHWPDWGRADSPKSAQKHDIVALCLLLFGEVPDPMPRSPIGHDASLDALTNLSKFYDELEHLVRAQRLPTSFASPRLIRNVTGLSVSARRVST